MAAGGARVRSGPPPNPNALRRDRDKTEWTHLPASGRAGDPPPWPLTRPTTRELAVWAEEWRRPQAIVWESRGQQLEVALYVRAVRVAEGAKANAADRKVVLTLMDDLGISSGGLARNRWLIVDEEGALGHGDREPSSAEPTSIKDRIKLLAGGATG